MSPWNRSSSDFRYFVPPKTFCCGSSESITPSARAVLGMSCMIPCAPRLETAFALKLDSRNAIAAIRFGSTRYFVAAAVMMLARYCGTGAGNELAAS